LSDDRQTPFISRARIGAVVFFAIFIVLLYQTALLIAPFSSALLWAAVIALAVHPAYRHTLKLVRHRSGLAAAVMTFVTLLLVIGPAIALLTALASQAVGLYQWASEGVASGSALELWNKLESFISRNIQSQQVLSGLGIKGMLVNGLGQFSALLASQVGSLLRNTALLAVNLVIMLIALFFFFKNGERYYRSVMDLLPFPHEQKQSVAQKLHDTFTAVINGVFLIALGQGLMTGVGFALFGVPFPVFWGALAAFLALLPIGGSALVWLPGALYLLLTGAALKGALLAAWGLVLVSLPDNFLKPLLIGKKSKLPTFFLFLGILGGLRVYGMLGILFGPLIVTLLTAVLQIYREEYAERQGGPDDR
jgi:predicted PurR-regulated permease PerM